MQKIYFIVGAAGTGTFTIASNLESVCQPGAIRKLGRPRNLENSGSTGPDETLDKIVKKIAGNSDQPDLIFVGWRVADHIEQIYNTYKNTATFIFTDNNQINPSDAGLLEDFATQDKIDSLHSAQTEIISNFLQSNSINLNYQTVAEPIFNSDKTLNVAKNGLRIAILGSM